MRAFRDSGDGYYEHDGADVPSWAANMTPCDLMVVVVDQIAIRNAKRAREYPPQEDLLDGMVKQQSADPLVKAAGVAQVADYYTKCLAVKAANP